MEDLRIEYSEKKHQSKKKKRFLFIIGIIMIIADLGLLVYQFTSTFNLSLLIPTIANILIGFVFILQAIEHRILYPKKYIHISSNYIEFKLGRFYKTKKLDWISVEYISSKKNSLNFYSGAQITSLKMFHFPSSDEKRIRSRITVIAENQTKEIN